MEKLESLVERLSGITDRLEKCANKEGLNEETSANIDAFQEIIIKVQAFADSCKVIDEEVHKHSTLLVECFKEELNVLKCANFFKKPADDQLKLLMSSLIKSMTAAQDFRTKATNKHNNHSCAIKEAVSALTWIYSTGKPSIAIDAAKEATQFYSNRVIKEFKEVPGHSQWVKDLLGLFEILKEFGQNYYPTGLIWKVNGKNYSLEEAKSVDKICTKSSDSTTQHKPANSTTPNANLFASLQNTDLTSGLKKVSDDQKTHKNPALRATSVVPESATTHSEQKEKKAAIKQPKLELINRKWDISHQNGKQDIKITGDNKHSAYLFDCVKCLATVSDKLNSMVLESCKNTSIVVENGLISTLEIINCQNIKIQCNNLLPTINVDKCSGVELYLTDKSYETEVVSTTSNSVNVSIISGENLVEHAAPEQFLIKYNAAEKKLDTKIIEKK